MPGNALSRGLAIPPGMYHPIPKQNMMVHNDNKAAQLIFVISFGTSLVATSGVGLCLNNLNCINSPIK
ncbi:hypothetical protein J6P11_05525 [bacterium]|nr:hypothetical protein [bacterium]